MTFPLAAITWEMGRKNRFGFLLLAFLLLFCFGASQLAAHFAEFESSLSEDLRRQILMSTGPLDDLGILEMHARTESWRHFALVSGGFLLGVSVLVLFGVCAFCESSRGGGFTGIPSRLFTLPVKTLHLVAVPILVGIFLVVIVGQAWSTLVFKPILPTHLPIPKGFFLLLFASSMVAFQALVWTLPAFPRIRATSLITLIALVVFTATIPFSENEWKDLESPLMVVWAVILAVSPLAAWIGVSRVRRGEWCEWTVLTRVKDAISNFLSSKRDLRTPAAAQFWMELRRIGPMALGGLTIVCLIIYGLTAFALGTGREPAKETVEVAFSAIVTFYVFVWSPLVGVGACGDGGSRRLRMSAFQATQPMTTGDYVAAKLKVMATVWFVGALVSVCAVLALGLRLRGGETLLSWFQGLEGIAPVTIAAWFYSIHVLLGLFPLWLAGRVQGSTWAFVGVLLAYGLVGHLIALFERSPSLQSQALAWIVAATALKLGIAALAFRENLRRRLMGRRFVWAVVGVWTLGTCVSIRIMSVLAEQAGWNEGLALAGAVLLFPLARIALAPLAADLNRHR